MKVQMASCSSHMQEWQMLRSKINIRSRLLLYQVAR